MPASVLFWLFFILPLTLSAYDLKGLLERGVSENLGIHAVRLKMEEQRQDKKIADHLFIPDLKMRMSSAFQKYMDSSVMAMYGSRIQNNLATIELVQDYPAWGKAHHLQRDLSRLTGNMLDSTLHQREMEVMDQAVRKFFEYVREVELGKIDQQNLFLINKLLEIARINQQVGLALQNDILRIEVQKLHFESELVGRKFQKENILIFLENLLNVPQPASMTLEVPDGLKFLPTDLDRTDSWEKLLTRDHAIQLARLDREIIETTLKAARQAGLPNVNLAGKVNFNNMSSNNQTSGAFNKDFQVNVSLDFPIFNSGDLRLHVKKIEKSFAQADLNFEVLVNNRRADFNQAWTDYQEAVERIRFAEKGLEQSRENMRVIAIRYHAGDASIVELVDAQMTLSNAAQTAIKHYFDERSRLAKLLILCQETEPLKHLDKEPQHEKLLLDFADLTDQ
jgi:outer membrane protein TolC